MRLHRSISLSIVVVAAGLAGCAQLRTPAPATAPPPAAPAEDAPSVAGLANATITAGDGALSERGYTATVTQDATTYWWHPAGSCVRVVTADDHYKVVAPALASECGH